MSDYVRCDECFIRSQPDEVFSVTRRYVNGEKLRLPETKRLCNHCADTCPLCGELLIDAAKGGPEIAVRLSVGLTFHGHALCAADNLLSEWNGEVVDSEQADKGVIERICVEGFWNE